MTAPLDAIDRILRDLERENKELRAEVLRLAHVNNDLCDQIFVLKQRLAALDSSRDRAHSSPATEGTPEAPHGAALAGCAVEEEP